MTAQDNTIQILSRTLQSSNLPHMLFYGPPGTGKTSTILALAKQLYGPELMKSRVLELNASDERGISIVRKKVKDFARQQLSSAPTYTVMTEDKDGGEGKMVRYRDKYPCPPFKIIVLDEADSMTQDAQSALRRTMETYSKMTRFCLVCNYVTRIIDPLASRCSKFRFKSLDQGNAVKRVEDIARLEGVALDKGVSEELRRARGLLGLRRHRLHRRSLAFFRLLRRARMWMLWTRSCGARLEAARGVVLRFALSQSVEV